MIRTFAGLFACALALESGCSKSSDAVTPPPPPPTDTTTVPVDTVSQASRVLIVVNGASADGMAIGRYYQAARNIPAANFITVQTTLAEDISDADFTSQILNPVTAKVHSLTGIDFIVTTHGIPLRVGGSSYSVDATLVGIDLNLTPIQAITNAEFDRATSPYYRKDESFSHAKYNMYLVTRLDGYDLNAMKALVDHSVAAKAETGLFFLDQGSTSDPYYPNAVTAVNSLTARGFTAEVEATSAFIAPTVPMMGYWSQGSNDPSYSATTYHALQFRPGAIAETRVSTSARTFYPTTGGQSLIADLVSQGVTGVKGYVDEPYSSAVAKQDILFDRYTRGYNLAESFYMASLLLKWKDVVIGDPLCRPYPVAHQ